MPEALYRMAVGNLQSPVAGCEQAKRHMHAWVLTIVDSWPLTSEPEFRLYAI